MHQSNKDESMVTKMFCDRCGIEVNPTGELFDISLCAIFFHSDGTRDVKSPAMHLSEVCKSCALDIQKTMTPLPLNASSPRVFARSES